MNEIGNRQWVLGVGVEDAAECILGKMAKINPRKEAQRGEGSACPRCLISGS